MSCKKYFNHTVIKEESWEILTFVYVAQFRYEAFINSQIFFFSQFSQHCLPTLILKWSRTSACWCRMVAPFRPRPAPKIASKPKLQLGRPSKNSSFSEKWISGVWSVSSLNTASGHWTRWSLQTPRSCRWRAEIDFEATAARQSAGFQG